MTPPATTTALLVVLAVAAGTGWLRRHALRAKWLDMPNARSSHSTPTPRGGGLAIVAGSSAGLSVLATMGEVDPALWLALVPGGIAVAAVGFIDDRCSLPPSLRLSVHVCAAAFALTLLGGVSPLQFGATVVDLGWVGNVFGLLAIVWTLNLFNFMDGIDGIAASEAVFITGVAVFLAFLSGSCGGADTAALILAAACLGFLKWNWPPARIFMGDVASGYIGYFIAVLALAAGRNLPQAPLVWLALGSAFFADATMTLVRRIIRGEHIHEAHRLHAYQRLAQRWQSHRRVTTGLLAANLAWSAPLAAIGALRPEFAVGAAGFALVGWLTFVVIAGAGRQETKE